MTCPHGTSTTPKERDTKTRLGYCTFHCSTCRRTFNERTGTPFTQLEYPTDLVVLIVVWRLRTTMRQRAPSLRLQRREYRVRLQALMGELLDV